MPIQVQCPNCKAVHQVADQMAGKRAKCRCGGVLAIPAAAAGKAPAQGRPAQGRPAQGQPRPAAANPAFGQLSADEMDDLFGSGADAPAAAATPDQKALPANLVGADAPQKKAPAVDPNAPQPVTGRDRRIAIMGIIAGIMSLPFGGIAAAIGVWLVLKSFDTSNDSSEGGMADGLIKSARRLFQASVMFGGLGMLLCSFAIPILSIGELKGRLPKSNFFYLVGTFGPLLIIVGTAGIWFLATVDQYDADSKAAQLDLETKKETGGADQKDTINYVPLFMSLLFNLGLTAGITLAVAIVPGFLMYVCRAHKPPPKKEEGL